LLILCVCARACFFSLFLSLSNTLSLSRSQNDAVVVTTVVPLVLPPRSSSSSSSSSSSYKSLFLSVLLTLSSSFFVLLKMYVLGFFQNPKLLPVVFFPLSFFSLGTRQHIL
jgi:hypothetical protein